MGLEAKSPAAIMTTDTLKQTERLRKILGVETGVDDVARTLKFVVQDFRPSVVGAMLLTCSDESEHECAEAFQESFADYLLPRLKYGHRAPFRAGACRQVTRELGVKTPGLAASCVKAPVGR